MRINTDWQSIPGMVDDPQVVLEYAALERRAERVYERTCGGTCIEIGSFWGKSAALLAQFFTVYAIDIWGLGEEQGNTGAMARYEDIGSTEGGFNRFIKHMTERRLIHWDKAPEGTHDRVYPICSTSKFLEHVPWLGASFAFIDAEHTYPAAYHDMRRVLAHMQSGGIIAIHDIARPGWGWGDRSRDDVDPWYGNFLSFNRLKEENPQRIAVVEHCEGIMFLEVR